MNRLITNKKAEQVRDGNADERVRLNLELSTGVAIPLSFDEKYRIMRIAGHLFAGFVCALVIGGIALLFAGAGHGWTSAIYGFVPSLIGATLATLAWAGTRRTIVLPCAMASLLIGLGTDLYLLQMTKEEGFSYFNKVWDLMPFLLTLWILLLVGWQLFAVVAIFKNKKVEQFAAPNP